MSNLAPGRAATDLQQLSWFGRVVRWGISATVFVVVIDLLAHEEMRELSTAGELGGGRQVAGSVFSIVLAFALAIVFAWLAGFLARRACRWWTQRRLHSHRA